MCGLDADGFGNGDGFSASTWVVDHERREWDKAGRVDDARQRAGCRAEGGELGDGPAILRGPDAEEWAGGSADGVGLGEGQMVHAGLRGGIGGGAADVPDLIGRIGADNEEV